MPLQVRDAFARKKHQLERAVKGSVARMRNKMRALEQQQAATEKAEATRKQADLLTANLWKCKQGDKEIEVLCLYIAHHTRVQCSNECPRHWAAITSLAGHSLHLRRRIRHQLCVRVPH